jgi:hypothetical protein
MIQFGFGLNPDDLIQTTTKLGRGFFLEKTSNSSLLSQG